MTKRKKKKKKKVSKFLETSRHEPSNSFISLAIVVSNGATTMEFRLVSVVYNARLA